MKWQALGAIFVVALASGCASGVAGQKNALTAQDYADIQELNARYARGFDFNEREGAAWAETFTEDGVFVVGGREVKGRPALVAYANDFFKTRGKGNTRHWVGYPILTLTAEGVVAKEYVLFINSANPVSTPTNILYTDLLMKTSEGWRLKRRAIGPS